MAVRIANAVARSTCDHINAKLDAGSGPGTLKVYDGARPATVDDAPTTQNVLVSFALGDPAFGAAVDANGGGTATASTIESVEAAASGTASWFRTFDSDGNAVFDGDVTDTSGNGDLKLSSTSVLSGIDVTVVSLTTTMPEGA